MFPKRIVFLLALAPLTGCFAPTASVTPIVTSTHGPTATSTATLFPEPTINERTPAPTPDIAVGASFIGTFQGRELTFLHVSSGFVEFSPETIEILDSSTKQVIAGPFPLARNRSGLCREMYDSEGLSASILPENFQSRVSSPPYYTFRVTGHRPNGEKVTREIITGAQFACARTTHPLLAGMSLVEYESSQKESEYYIHVKILDQDGGFLPETVEFIDPDTNSRIAGPFQVISKVSELCYGEGYETENVLPFLHGDQPLAREYLYRVRLSNDTGQEITFDAQQDPDICRSVILR